MEDWALCWVKKIGKIYHINHLRCKNFDAKISAQNQCEAFKKQHKTLVENMDAMACERDDFIKKHNSKDMDASSNAKYKVLKSLKNHWEGLSVFMDHPEVPMDNNKAERSIRNPVTGRKNFYGSGSLWSSQLAAMMFSIFQTMGLWKFNRSHWLKSYLIACAENHGKAPEDLSPFLPWEMDKKRAEKFSRPYET